MDPQKNAEALAWQISVWDRMVPVYTREIDKRFGPIVEGVVKRADLAPGQHVLDLGTGTGSVALRAAEVVAPNGRITALDISPDMLAIARQRAASAEANITFVEGRAEAIPADAASIDAVLASLSLMYVIDRAAAAREIARVLRPGGRLVAAVWAGPEQADIVLFQQTAGSFAPEPPVPGVGPGALGDPASFLTQLVDAGLKAHVDTTTVEFTFDNFESAWDALAAVTASRLQPERAKAAKAAVRKRMWPKGDGLRCFRNETHFVIGDRTS
jgi:enediyne biosynthesis protein CalE5